MSKQKIIHSYQDEFDKPKRKHCPNCLFFLDGKPELDQDGRHRFFHIPGMQFHRMSQGTIYARAGHTTPCTCETGKLVAAGYSEKEEL